MNCKNALLLSGDSPNNVWLMGPQSVKTMWYFNTYRQMHTSLDSLALRLGSDYVHDLLENLVDSGLRH